MIAIISFISNYAILILYQSQIILQYLNTIFFALLWATGQRTRMVYFQTYVTCL